MPTESLRIENLTTGYGRRKVLKNLSMVVEEGSVVGIIGPNGHGKSTLVKALSGLISTWEGRIFLKNTSIDNLPAHERVEKGLIQIPQGDLIFPDMTVEENLMLGGYLIFDKEELGRRLEKVYRIFSRLLERRKQITRTLSGGERRMLSIGRGLMSEGYMMILDEPSLGLAPKIIDQVYEIIAGLRQISPTLLVIEENPTRLQNIADIIYLLDDGEFIWSGTPSELKENEDMLNTYLGI
ncbi:ABC transporter ATP-binding protein [Alphaproteobacteria bacterium]|jgi:branched-chain amino acid transport system ATP-binding protein|nr:ABC transporter ATP-binding protein [Alphaproteobacteria bacterium]|tara:strand:+ start:2949 stop:3665 length:717 start_codon:yes stop_codon:yes gene_type:complete